MLEILSPAGSPEGVVAAVQNGADAIYLDYSDSDARAKSNVFTRDDFGRALEYCRVRGVKAYLLMDRLAYDRELPQIAERAKEACRLGIDAVILRDFGVLVAVRQAIPEVPVHASPRMSVHSIDGVKVAAAMGFKRVAIANELSRKKIAYICRHSPIEIEVSVHGAQCFCYTGQCYMSSAIGRGSDNRKACSEPCRLNYNAVGHSVKHPLSLKDGCLIRHLDDLDKIGVSAIRIDGQMKRPEYSAIVTGVYSKVAHKGRFPEQDDLSVLQTKFSRQGFTDGYYTEQHDTEMLGIQEEDSRKDSVVFSTARKNYLNGELQRVPVWFVGTVGEGKKAKLAVIDDRKNTAVVYGPTPEPAFHKELSLTSLQTQLHKTGGTPFMCVGVKGTVERGLALPMSVWVDMRHKLFAEIVEQRKPVKERAEGEFTPGLHKAGFDGTPLLAVSVMKAEQISEGMAELAPDIVYVPVMDIFDGRPALRDILSNDKINVVVALPRIIHDNERKNVSEMIKRAQELGITEALVGNIGQIHFARNLGMDIRGDFGLNAFNSETLKVLRFMGLQSATLSFELQLAEIRNMSKQIDTELIVYGRLPLMVTELCIAKNCTGACTCDSFSGLVNEQGALYPVVAEFGCRNTLLNSKKLFMADKRRAIAGLGLWAQRLMFTTENALECVAVMKRYMGQSNYTPSGFTRGLYYKGVE